MVGLPSSDKGSYTREDRMGKLQIVTDTERLMDSVREAVQERERMLIENGDLRRQLAECQAKLASIPSAAIRRSFYTGYSSDAQVEEDEIAIAAWLEAQP